MLARLLVLAGGGVLGAAIVLAVVAGLVVSLIFFRAWFTPTDKCGSFDSANRGGYTSHFRMNPPSTICYFENGDRFVIWPSGGVSKLSGPTPK